MTARQRVDRHIEVALPPVVFAADPPPTTSDAELCTECRQRPRAANGRLSRCMPCVQAAAEQARQSRAAAEARKANATVEAKAPAVPAKRRRKAGLVKTAKKAIEAKPLQSATDPAIKAEIEKLQPVKACRCCKQSKALDEFARHHMSRDGHRHDCKTCVRDGKARAARELSAEQIAKDKARRAQPHRREANRKAVRRWSERNEAAVHARAVLRRAVRKGLVERATECQVEGCQSTHRLEAHHHSYSAPIEAAWLCCRHHRRLHNGARLRLKPPTPQRLAGIPDDLN